MTTYIYIGLDVVVEFAIFQQLMAIIVGIGAHCCGDEPPTAALEEGLKRMVLNTIGACIVWKIKVWKLMNAKNAMKNMA